MKASVIALLMLCVSCVSAGTLWVPLDYPTIQQAIDESSDGDVVIVSPGHYLENINFLGKAITVRGTNPQDEEIVRATIIDANGEGSTVIFESNEPNTAVLTGFTITGGKGTFIDNSYPWGGGIFCRDAGPTITHNLIVDNHLDMTPIGHTSYQSKGGGIAVLSGHPTITHNTIRDNTGFDGGGLRIEGNALLKHNLIYNNIGVICGGIYISGGGQLINNTIVNNGNNIFLNGACLIKNNIVYNAGSGINMSWINHPTREDMLQCVERIEYNNVWHASAQGVNYGSFGTETVHDGPVDWTGYLGNISVDPLFIDPNSHNYHVAGNSPCINAGDPNTPVGDEPEPNGERINLGAYGGTVEANPGSN